MKRIMVNMTDEKYEKLRFFKKRLQKDGLEMSDSSILNYCFNIAYKEDMEKRHLI